NGGRQRLGDRRRPRETRLRRGPLRERRRVIAGHGRALRPEGGFERAHVDRRSGCGSPAFDGVEHCVHRLRGSRLDLGQGQVLLRRRDEGWACEDRGPEPDRLRRARRDLGRAQGGVEPVVLDESPVSLAVEGPGPGRNQEEGREGEGQSHAYEEDRGEEFAHRSYLSAATLDLTFRSPKARYLKG